MFLIMQLGVDGHDDLVMYLAVPVLKLAQDNSLWISMTWPSLDYESHFYHKSLPYSRWHEYR